MSLPPKDIGCHRTAFAKTCFECVTEHRCRLWTFLQGKHPQTGADVQQWGCADEFTPLLLIENAQMSRQTGAAVESFRNEVLKREDERDARTAELLQFARGGAPRLVSG